MSSDCSHPNPTTTDSVTPQRDAGAVGRRGRHAFLDHWHRRHLELPDGTTLHWVLMAAPGRVPAAECFRITTEHGASRGVHPTEAVRLLTEHGHPDAEHVRLDRHAGTTFSH